MLIETRVRHKCDSDQEAEDAVTISWRYLEVFVFDDIFHSNLARTRFGHQRSHLVLGIKSLLRNISSPWKKIYAPISISSISLPSLQSEGAGGLGRGRGTSSASMSLLNLIPFPPQTSKFYLEEEHLTPHHTLYAPSQNNLFWKFACKSISGKQFENETKLLTPLNNVQWTCILAFLKRSSENPIGKH